MTVAVTLEPAHQRQRTEHVRTGCAAAAAAAAAVQSQAEAKRRVRGTGASDLGARLHQVPPTSQVNVLHRGDRLQLAPSFPCWDQQQALGTWQKNAATAAAWGR
jgi:hypothetical protein